MKENYIGETIKRERKKQRLTQQQVAEKCGLTYASVLNIESGKGCNLNSIQKICKVLGLELKITN